MEDESETVQIIRVIENCPLETRSIFKMTGEKYNEIQEQTLIFMEDQLKNGGRIVIPDINTKIVAGYNSVAKTFFVYDIFQRRLYRHFSIRNPNFKSEVPLKQKSKASMDLDRMIEELDDGHLKSPRQSVP